MDRMIETVKSLAEQRIAVETRAGFLHLLDIVVNCKQLGGFEPDEAEALYGAVFSLLKFNEKRGDIGAKVACFNPTIDGDGWESDHTVIHVVNDNMPFLMDSVVNLLTEKSISIHTLMHPIVSLARDDTGKRLHFLDHDGEGAVTESLMQIQIDRRGSVEECEGLQRDILALFADIKAVVDDWPQMIDHVKDITAGLRANAPNNDDHLTEVVDFIDWLRDDHFIFFGCRRFDFSKGGVKIVKGSGLGLMREPDFTVLRDGEGGFSHWTEEMETFVNEPSPVLILKANRKNTIHRMAHFDYIGVKHYDAKGKLVGKDVLIGLFTSASYNRNAKRIPLLRQKVARIHELAGFAPGSHDDKALANVLETYPRDELFQIAEDHLLSNAVGIMQLATRPRASVFVRPDRFSRFVSCLTYVPRESYTTELRKKIGDILADVLDGRVAEFTPYFGEGTLVRIHFIVAAKAGDISEIDIDLIKARLRMEVRGWADELKDALVHHFGEAEGNTLFGRYGNGFGSSYRDTFSTAVAAADIQNLEATNEAHPLSLKFYHRMVDPANAVRLKLFYYNDPLPLSDCLPVLEGMGLRVLQEHPYKVCRGDELIWVHDFYMQTANGQDININALSAKLEEGFQAVWTGKVDNDPFNKQILLSGLTIRQIVLLRAISKYLAQAGLAFSAQFVEEALNQNPDIAAALVALFISRFDPEREKGREKAQQELAKQIEAALEQVSSLQVDQVLRRFFNAIQSMLRTNYFQHDASGALKPYLSFKFNSGNLDGLPLPRPWREVFVYSTWVEGVHLRFGPIARGGLRWSDRSEDYRTEVLGLVKAQQVKNAVIVPVGSKGGFLPKSLPENGTRDAVQAEAIRCYKTYLSGILDITDNLVDNAVVPPQNVVRHDADDPYLVVAADKGTATFSDIANGVAADYGFWLDDAFASGGSHGYDHKGMGITARGAWEAVKRHFRELGLDTQTEPFEVIGVGDMSGDVFGNGMLLSEQIKLVAAFDHRDIFIDPSPDAGAGFAERQRLFNTPRCTWQDYDKGLISKGGGVFSRSAKSIALTPEIKAITGLTKAKVTPPELIKALLKSPTDMIWFGGIGTYIKSTSESHADAGDRANDLIRIDATEVRARVIGEGANLGVTQRGRVEMALNGVRLNTDAVDNSAGVDCSDHEVNIKIALGSVVASGDMTGKQRNTLLAGMTDDVARLVLQTNYNQTLAISLVEARAPALVDEHIALMQAFEARDLLNRRVEYLPGNDALRERAETGRGLTRPEISVLVAYAKNVAFGDLIKTDLPDDPYFEALVLAYMPDALQQKFKAAVLSHRLRREIVATILVNRFVDQTGPTFFVQADAAIDQSIAAFVAVTEMFGLAGISADINALDNKVPAELQVEMHLLVAGFTRELTHQLLEKGIKTPVAELIARYKEAITALHGDIDNLLPAFLAERLRAEETTLTERGISADLAARLSRLAYLNDALLIADFASRHKLETGAAAAIHFEAGSHFGLNWLRLNAQAVKTRDQWEGAWLARLQDEMRGLQLGAAVYMVGKGARLEQGQVVGLDQPWQAAGDTVQAMVDDLKSGGPLTIAKLTVVASKTREILDRLRG